MKNIHILFLVPIWCLILIPFMPDFFKMFPYHNRNIIKKWHGEVYLESSLRNIKKDDFIYVGKFYKAYIKIRIRALLVSMKYRNKEFGIEYVLSVNKEN